MTPEPIPLPLLGRILRNTWLGVLLASLAVLLGLTLMAVTVGDPLGSSRAGRIMTCAAVVPVLSCLGLVAATVICRRQLAVFMSISMVITALAAVGWCVLIWRHMGFDPPGDVMLGFKVASTLTLVGGGLALAGLLLTTVRRQPLLDITAAIVLGSGLLAEASLLLVMWSHWWQRFPIVLFGMLAAGLGVVTMATLAHGLMTRIYRAREKRLGDSVPRRLEMTLECPGCGEEQTLPTGLARCALCGTPVLIDLEEPRCECGYLLYQLQGESCPECGRPVSAEQRWETPKH